MTNLALGGMSTVIPTRTKSLILQVTLPSDRTAHRSVVSDSCLGGQVPVGIILPSWPPLAFQGFQFPLIRAFYGTCALQGFPEMWGPCLALFIHIRRLRPTVGLEPKVNQSSTRNFCKCPSAGYTGTSIKPTKVFPSTPRSKLGQSGTADFPPT